MRQDVIKYLEEKGYTFIELVEDTQNYSKYSAVDPYGYTVEVMYETHDHYLLDRAKGSAFWDIIEKVEL